MQRATKRTSTRKRRKRRPDALSPEEPKRAAGNAGRHRGKIDRRVVLVRPRALSPQEAAQPPGPAVGNRTPPVFSGPCDRKLGGLHELSWRRSLQSSAVGCDRYHIAARRVSHFLHAVSGGDFTGHPAGDF